MGKVTSTEGFEVAREAVIVKGKDAGTIVTVRCFDRARLPAVVEGQIFGEVRAARGRTAARHGGNSVRAFAFLFVPVRLDWSVSCLYSEAKGGASNPP